MAHDIAYNSEQGIIELTYHGEIDPAALKSSAADVYHLAKERSCCVALIDWSQSRLGVGVSGIYDLPRVLSSITESLGLNIHKIKRALLVKEKTEGFRFLENVTRNRGQNVRLFTDRAEAIEWLVAADSCGAGLHSPRFSSAAWPQDPTAPTPVKAKLESSSLSES